MFGIGCALTSDKEQLEPERSSSGGRHTSATS
jgi:hypothetical protein